MLTHEQIWRGVDRLALHNSLTPSGLAKRAGLDPTTFNKSKRITHEGKQRWPSTESISKILEATQTTFMDFVGLIDQEVPVATSPGDMRLKSIRLSTVSEKNFDAAGFPNTNDWEELEFPQIEDTQSYVIEIDKSSKNSFLRSGDLIVVAPSSSVRRHDRVFIFTSEATMHFGTLKRKTTSQVIIQPFDDTNNEHCVSTSSVLWISRIIWIGG
jgi:phage repressor protein C with HTH and peptisase S24 domain